MPEEDKEDKMPSEFLAVEEKIIDYLDTLRKEGEENSLNRVRAIEAFIHRLEFERRLGRYPKHCTLFRQD